MELSVIKKIHNSVAEVGRRVVKPVLYIGGVILLIEGTAQAIWFPGIGAQEKPTPWYQIKISKSKIINTLQWVVSGE